MKHLCCSKIYIFLLLVSSLYASITDKSAIVYFGKNISYPMVGIHDYIIVNPKNINIYGHGFDIYKEHIYPRVYVVDGFEKKVDRLLKKGYKNIYFIQDKQNDKFIKYLYQLKLKYSDIKIILKADEKFLKNSINFIDAIVVYNGLKNGGKKLKNYKKYFLDVIDVEIVSKDDLDRSDDFIAKIKSFDVIPYISTKKLKIYGKSSKNAIKREIFTIIDEHRVDRVVSSAHQCGAMPLEYMGYIQHIHDVSKKLPNVDEFVTQYAGVVVWLSSDIVDFEDLFYWILDVMKKGIKVSFVSNFGFMADGSLLNQIGIETTDSDIGLKNKKYIFKRDDMVGFEVEPQINNSRLYLNPIDAIKPILTYEDNDGKSSTPSAIMPWGGYAVFGSALFDLDDNNLWVLNPFKYFKESLSLKTIPIADVTTQNGNRILFTHVDGDGILNVVESNPNIYAGENIYNEILSKYKVPHSVSVIGADISPQGLYPQFAHKLQNITKKFYSLENVEPATHTFSHPFSWMKIKDNDLSEKYRLKPKGYKFSLYNELKAPLEFIQNNLIPKNSYKKAQTIFWSGDCSPSKNVLKYVYKNRLLNINGGYTTISNTNPWLSLVSPMGVQRGEYTQVYTGAENENVYTNDWLGPFWGFKKVVQTFKRTDSPRRLKPIDIYYHLYSGSKIASINAIKYVFDWALKCDINPIYTSEYIPKVYDFYTISIAKDKNLDRYLISGAKNLKTIRFDNENGVDFKKSKTVLGKRYINNSTYISLDNHQEHIISLKKDTKEETYLESLNGIVKEFINGVNSKRYDVKSYLDLKVTISLKDKSCLVKSNPKEYKRVENQNKITLLYKDRKEATIDVLCK